jgi:hypothetical protein
MDSQEQKLYKKTFPKRPLDVVHLSISFVQKWTLLMKPPGTHGGVGAATSKGIHAFT